jgi:hypothetical protein
MKDFYIFQLDYIYRKLGIAAKSLDFWSTSKKIGENIIFQYTSFTTI